MPTYTFIYRHDRDPNGSGVEITVEAADEGRATMLAGMARAESFAGRFLHDFYFPHRLTWSRTLVKEES